MASFFPAIGLSPCSFDAVGVDRNGSFLTSASFIGAEDLCFGSNLNRLTTLATSAA